MIKYKYVIYALLDPRSKQWRYIGKSKYGLDRLKHHLKPSSLKKKTHKNHWIKSLLNIKLNPEIEIIEEFASEKVLFAAEREWIAAAKMAGCELTNSTDGGEGLLNFHHSRKTKKKFSKLFSGRRNPMYGQKHSESIKNKMRISKIGYQVPESTREASLKAIKGVPKTHEHRRKIGISNGSKPFKDENDNIFYTCREAARQLNCDSSSISKVLRGKYRHTQGHTFSYITDRNEG